MNRFFAKVVALFNKLFGGDKNMELPKIELNDVVRVPPAVVAPTYTLVAVRPTGVNGVGKTRFYPKAVGGDKENLFGYLVNLANTIDITNGQPFLNAQARAEISNLMLKPDALPRNPEDWPAYADALNFPNDWRSQVQLDAMNPAKQQDPYYDNPVGYNTLSNDDKIYLHALNRTYIDIYFYFLRGYKSEILRTISSIDAEFAAQAAEFDVNNYRGSLLYWAPSALERWTKDHAKRG